MRAVDIIRKKRDGKGLTVAEIQIFVDAATTGAWPSYQVSALLMAIVLRGMTPEETAALTAAMVQTGVRLDWSGLPGIKVDKHSTGGVGDKTSLILAPLAAACGVIVPMMSGRGLGHTGGTLDKLEAIPGFRVGLSLDEFRTAIQRVGCALIGQTAEIAPADKVLYALRDVTATVESIPLITASILSKKIAEGISALVMDVKCGRGAFMKTRRDARELADSLVRIGNANGVRTQALLTAMDVPLGRAIGNSLEVIECLETLKGHGPADLESLSVELAARMVLLGQKTSTLEEATQRVRQVLTSGHGIEKFREIIRQQGGDERVIDDYTRLPSAPNKMVISSDRAGFVSAMDAEEIGIATMLLGAGRNRVEDVIDPAVGAKLLAKPGDELKIGDPLVELHYRSDVWVPPAVELVRSACKFSTQPPDPQPIILETIE